jgi:hypothetical protein
MGLILLIVLVLFLVGGLPRWGYHTYGYDPPRASWAWCWLSSLLCS